MLISSSVLVSLLVVGDVGRFEGGVEERVEVVSSLFWVDVDDGRVVGVGVEVVDFCGIVVGDGVGIIEVSHLHLLVAAS